MDEGLEEVRVFGFCSHKKKLLKVRTKRRKYIASPLPLEPAPTWLPHTSALESDAEMARRYDSRTYVCSPVFSPALEVAPTRVHPAANADAVSPPPSPGARTRQNNLLARGASLPGRVCFGEYQLVCSTVSPRRRNGLGFWLGASGARWGLIDEAPTGEGSRGAGLELSVFPFAGAGSLHSKAAPPPTPPLATRTPRPRGLPLLLSHTNARPCVRPSQVTPAP